MNRKYIRILLLIFFVSSYNISFGQTTIFSEGGGGTTPSGWTFNNSGGNDIDRNSYWLVDALANENIITAAYDLSSYSTAEFRIDVATFGSGSANPALIEISYDNGVNYSQSNTSATPSGSSYITGGPISLTGTLSSQVVIRISNNSTSGRGVRLRNLELVASGSSGNPTISFDSSSSSETETDSDVVTSGILLTMTNYGGSNVTITPTVNGSSTAESGDYTIELTPLTFVANETKNIPLTIKDDADFNDETLIVDFSVTSGTADLGTSQHTVTILDDDVPSLIITEVADPVDASGRFVEIYNTGDTSLDLSSLQVYFVKSINAGTSYSQTALSGTIEPNQIMVIANPSNMNADYGFSPDVDYNDADGNGDDAYALYLGGNRSSGTLLDAYGVQGVDGSGQAWEYENSRAIRNNPASATPNANWTAVEWTISAADIADMTPGALENEFRYDGDWKPRDVYANSSTSDDVYASSSVLITGNLSVNDFEVKSGATLTIDKTASVTITGNFTNNGTFTLDSDSDEFSSIIIDGTPSGNITYNLWVNSVDNGSTGWDLVGSPASGVTITSITGDSDLATNGSSPTTYALGSFSNTDLSWSNVNSDDTSGTLTSGQGYQMATTSGGTITFNGSVLTSSQNISITNNNPNDNGDSNLTGSRWNLIANPFPSYINANTSADSNHNFLSDNLGGSINNNYTALYAYDANGGYTPINNTSAATYIAPGQGFFVASVVGGGTITFDANTRTTTGGDDFVPNRMANTSQEFYLRLYEDDNLIEDNKFYFDNGLTLGLDPGYDAGAFDQNMDIMSRLSENDQGVGFSINAMGLNSLETNTVIPMVFNRTAGVEFSVSFEDASIPEGIGIYLQDTLLETLTDLRAEDFTLTPGSDLSDMGRFFIVIGNTSLGGNDLEASYISIYKAASEDHITIEGLLNVEKANVQLFNIIGQEVLNTTLQSNQSIQSISTAGLTTGVYIVRLEADNSIVTKKVIIN